MTGHPAPGPCPHCGQQHSEDVLICPTSDKVLPLQGRVLDGKFRFLSQLGEGGMGSVWKAENVLVHKMVALKLMHAQFSRDEAVLARFRNEATAAGRIGSNNICDILDLGNSVLGPYIVMEMLNGSDFSDFVRKHNPVDPGTVVMVMRQALIGLQAAHDVGIVHRDLKPENIFLHEPEPGHLRVKLMDFGISKFTEGTEAGKTGMGVLMGTPEYMSPEQTEGAAQADHRTDIWAMGVILYWALSGRNPFLGSTLAATLMNVTMKEPPPLQQVAPHVPQELVDIVHRCMHKNPDERFQSSRELSDALQPFENLQGQHYVPYGSGGGTALSRPTGGVASMGPQAQPSRGPMAAGATMASSGPPPGARPPGPSSPTPDGSPTFSNEFKGLPGTSPTLGDADFTFGGAERPESTMSGGKGMLVVFLILGVALLGVAAYFVYMQTVDAPSVASSESAGEAGDDGAAVAGDEGGEAKSDEGGAAADEGGEAADEGGEAADEGGEAADEGGEAADDGGEAADDGGAGDDEGGAAADEGGAADDGGQAGDEGGAGDDDGGGDGGKSSGGGSKKPRGPDRSKALSLNAKFYRSRASGKAANAAQANNFCQGLASKRYGRVSGWRLPGPGQLGGSPHWIRTGGRIGVYNPKTKRTLTRALGDITVRCVAPK